MHTTPQDDEHQIIDRCRKGDREAFAVLVDRYQSMAYTVACRMVGDAEMANDIAQLAGLALATVITFYDWYHKKNPLSPVVMGICRVLVYVGAGLCYTATLPAAVWVGAGLMLCYLIGLTYIAKQENLGCVENLWPLIFLGAPVVYGGWLAMQQAMAGVFWLLFTGWMLVALWFLRRRRKGDIPRAVVSLIAGISLLDAMLMAGTGALALAGVALLGFGVTLFFQRYISGT